MYMYTHIQVKLLQHTQNTTAFREGISCQSTTHPSPPTPQAFAHAHTHTLSLSLWWVPAPCLPLVGAHTSQAMYTKHLIKTTVSVHPWGVEAVVLSHKCSHSTQLPPTPIPLPNRCQRGKGRQAERSSYLPWGAGGGGGGRGGG